MSFLSTAFLIALPLAAAPILLHLFDRRRHVVIPWGAMQFLAEAASRKTSARKLKQWLLLLLRTLAIAALVFALARPMLPGSWLASAPRTETIFIVDNSMSMMRKTGQTTLFDAAIAQTIEQISQLEPGNFVRVLLGSPYPVWATTGSVRIDAGASSALEKQLRRLRPTEGQSDLLAALFAAAQTEVQPTQQRRRIVLLSDGQRSDWSIEDEPGWQRFRDIVQSASTPTELQIVQLEHAIPPAANVAIGSLRSSRTLAGVNQPLRLTAHIQNHGDVATSPTVATWTVDQKQLHESQVPTLNDGGQHDLVWRHSFSEPGVYAVSCRLAADDQLAADNKATVVVEVVDELPIIVVESAADLADIQQDSFFLQAALGWIEGQRADDAAVYAPTVVEPQQLARVDLKQHSVVVIPHLTSLEPETIQQLQQFVNDGGGLWLALGPRSDVDAFNELLFAGGAGLVPLAIDQLVEHGSAADNGDNEAGITIDPFLEEHPATAELARHEQLDLGDVHVTQRFRFLSSDDDAETAVLLSLSNGEPLVVEKYVGRGRVIVQAIPQRMQWSELVRSQAFVVMVHDWLDYLAQPGATRHNLQPGDPIALSLSNAESPHAILHTPHGDEIELSAEMSDDHLVFRSSRTILPGDYSLQFGLSGDSVPFHVHRDPEESQLASLSAEQLKRLTDTSATVNNSGTPLETKQANPLWPVILMMLIALMSFELLLSGRIAREHFGGERIAETTDLQTMHPVFATSSPEPRSRPAHVQQQPVRRQDVLTPD